MVSDQYFRSDFWNLCIPGGICYIRKRSTLRRCGCKALLHNAYFSDISRDLVIVVVVVAVLVARTAKEYLSPLLLLIACPLRTTGPTPPASLSVY